MVRIEVDPMERQQIEEMLLAKGKIDVSTTMALEYPARTTDLSENEDLFSRTALLVSMHLTTFHGRKGKSCWFLTTRTSST